MPNETKSFATWEDALRFCISEHEQGHVAEAEAGYAQLLHVQPDHVDGLRLRGLALTQLGKPDEGLPHLQRACHLAPQYALAHLHLAYALQQLNRDDEAARHLGTAADLDPSDPVSRVNLAGILIKQQQFPEAIQRAKQATLLSPNLAPAAHNLGLAYLEAGMPEQAMEPLETAVRLQPVFPEAWMHLGRAHVDQGRLEDAANAYLECLRQDPSHVAGAVNLANVWLRRDLIDDAIDLYRQILTYHPDNWKTQLALANALADDDRAEEALSILKTITYPEQVRDKDYLNQASILDKAGQTEEARQVLQSITSWGIYSFNAQWVHYRLGDIAFPINPTGNIFIWGLSGSQLVYANDRSRWSVNEGFNHVSNDVKVYQDVIPGGYPLTVQHYNYFDVGTQWSLSYNLLHKSGSLNTALTYNQGMNGSHGTLNNQIPGYPAAQFHYFVANVSTTQSLPLGMSASFSASGQGAFNTLPQENQWVLGGFGSLSAYYPGVLVGDSGYSARFQLQSPSWAFHGFSTSANLFAETGGTTYTYLARNQTPWQSLSDVGLGINMQSPWGTSISVLSALPVGWNHVSASTRKASRVDAYFVLSQNF
jgi:tetratricopeptide (TPR) repeat protein